MDWINLTENDVPGAKLANYNNIEVHSVSQLKRWLQCRGLKTSGNKAALVQRVAAALECNAEIDPAVDGGCWFNAKNSASTSTVTDVSSQQPTSGWKALDGQKVPVLLNEGHVYHYLVESIQSMGSTVASDLTSSDDDSQTLQDFSISKPLSRGKRYFESDFVVNVKYNYIDKNFYASAQVQKSMGQTFYSVSVCISVDSGYVKHGKCECKASAPFNTRIWNLT